MWYIVQYTIAGPRCSGHRASAPAARSGRGVLPCARTPILYYTILYYIIVHYTILYYTIRYYTILY